MINVNYQKRKNTELFKSLEKSSSLFLSKTQNYIPIYKEIVYQKKIQLVRINISNKFENKYI